MKSLLKSGLMTLVLSLGASTLANAHGDRHPAPPPPPPPPPPVCDPPSAPEVDPGMAISGLTLLAGTLTVMRASRRKQLGAN
jgi:hypothetical protein